MAALTDVMNYVACVFQETGIKVSSPKCFKQHRHRRRCANKLRVECERFLAARVPVLDLILCELRSDLVICCPANPFGQRTKSNFWLQRISPIFAVSSNELLHHNVIAIHVDGSVHKSYQTIYFRFGHFIPLERSRRIL